jgi:nucleotide-binding universal stress UspA family protein
MKNILLPTDFSENSWNAIKYALRFYEQYSCNFYLLHVYRLSSLVTEEAPYLSTNDTIENLYINPSKQKLRKILKRISTEQLSNKKHKIYTLTDYNFFIESIRKHVVELNIDIIVMGTKGASGIKKHIVGSNTGDVITKVKCATLAIPENAEFSKLNEIAFPTDFVLSYDIRALQPISDILEKTKATLRILYIKNINEKLNTEQLQHKELLEDVFEEYENSVHFLTNKKVEDAVQCFVESRNIDLIVMIAKNLNYFQQILFHSKVEKISYHTNVPFLVLHE